MKYAYQNFPISFVKARSGNVMINATEMAKPFGKKANDFLKTTQTQNFIKQLSEVRKINSSDLVIVVYGDNGGTWMHEDVAMEFARWLSPLFAIWCNDHIKQLLTEGNTSMGSISEDETILKAIKLLTERVETQKVQLELADNTIKQQAPKVEYYNNVLDSKALIPTTLIAKDLGMSAVTLNGKLHQMGIIFREAGTWVPYSKYQSMGFCRSKTFSYTDSEGTTKTAIHFYWTEKGREFIMNKILRKAA